MKTCEFSCEWTGPRNPCADCAHAHARALTRPTLQQLFAAAGDAREVDRVLNGLRRQTREKAAR